MRCSLAMALVVNASGCAKHESSPGTSASSGSSRVAGSAATTAAGSGAASGTSADPWAKPAGDAPCDDTDIQRHIDASLKASLAYLDALEHATASWKRNCEAARKDLLALEPQASAFMAAMQQFMTWGRTLSPACGKRVGELGEQTPAARDIEKRTPGIEAKVKPILERCKDHPGFQDAAAKGLRLLRRKHE
jgi:hypothetical protein